MIPALLAAATFSAGAFAHGGDRDDWRSPRYDRHDRHHHVVRHAPPPPVVHVRQRGYRPAPVAYHSAPPLPYPPLPSERTVGRAVGAVAGGVIGHQVGDGHLAPILIGAVLGGVIGDQIAR
ncbi:MAG: glycine zipper 2TM domain-containing protein [Rhodocyclales bacterium]|nr:glycine zipper 2TM domain-containing protein [Rhodocyclales bacterium]